jgi:hypothetical protein
MDLHAFVIRRKVSGASEPANYSLFLSELRGVLGRNGPAPQDTESATGIASSR